jgi:hypothetical protein
MIKALLLIFEPIATWEGIVRAQRSMAFILAIYLLPLLLLTSAAEGYGLVHWGKRQGEVPRLRTYPPGEAIVVETAQVLLALAVVFFSAKVLKSLGETFHGRNTYTQAFTAVAYSLSPLFLLRLLDAFAWINPWVSWSIGILLSVAVLYQGVPRTMEPDPSHAFGLYLMSAVLLMLVSGLVRYATAKYLQGECPAVQSLVSELGARLPL